MFCLSSSERHGMIPEITLGNIHAVSDSSWMYDGGLHKIQHPYSFGDPGFIKTLSRPGQAVRADLPRKPPSCGQIGRWPTIPIRVPSVTSVQFRVTHRAPAKQIKKSRTIEHVADILGQNLSIGDSNSFKPILLTFKCKTTRYIHRIRILKQIKAMKQYSYKRKGAKSTESSVLKRDAVSF